MKYSLRSNLLLVTTAAVSLAYYFSLAGTRDSAPVTPAMSTWLLCGIPLIVAGGCATAGSFAFDQNRRRSSIALAALTTLYILSFAAFLIAFIVLAI